MTSLPRQGTAAEQRLADARAGTLALVDHLPPDDLERVIDPIMSPLVWDLAHIAAYEDLWIAHRHGGLELLRPDLAAVYDAFETPRAVRGDVELLDTRGAHEYLEQVRARTLDVLARRGEGDGILVELVLRHELQHTETMRQCLALGGLLPAGEGRLPAVARDGSSDWVDVPGGTYTIGAGPEGFAYDNERPRHAVELEPFRIARRPVTNATWLTFAEGGGYERREWWPREAFEWKEDYGIWEHPGAAAGDPDAPAMCVSWFEADALARSLGARLPTEEEWEVASTSGQLRDTGAVWEWTASPFRGYDGFVPFPYREYSEPFFGDAHRVLRGGSWATHPRLRSPTFRNWDLPQRRQLFAGVRLALPPRRPGARAVTSTPTTEGRVTIDLRLDALDERALADDVLDGLTRPFKELKPKHLYDQAGAELFDRICDQPEYYPTRAERAILTARAGDLAASTGAVELVELGAGTAAKTRVLIAALVEAGTLERYVPLDVTEGMVRDVAADLTALHPTLRVHGIVGDFERHLDALPEPLGPRAIAFLGGTIGNFTPGTRRSFLRDVRRRMTPDDVLLLGCDLVKDPAVIEAAYDDAAGVSAAFARNGLSVINRELGADFDPERFEYVAFYDREREWVDMRLRATERMDVRVPALDLDVTFAPREELRTEISTKFTRERIEQDLDAAGLAVDEVLTDPDGLFALVAARPRR